ncbi:uncharacterized protein LOC141593087 [Silene latifolia]|uniref:uncharacterized protein LOC141593087 n=1 Tax=Silene latifolia TaxID=37657 RepID=UPI003D7808F0
MGSRYEDFEEGEVWGVLGDNNNSNNNGKVIRKSMKDSTFFTTNNNSSSSRNSTVVNAPRMIPRSSPTEAVNNKQSSAPLDIPDWSKIYGHTSKKKNGTSSSSSSSSSSTWLNNVNNDVMVNGHHHHHNDHDGYYSNHTNGNGYNGNGYDGNCYGYGHGHHDDDDGDDNDDDDMVPPHEYLARKLARNQISSFSVYEGIGRTLKGRDLSKVRNTILSKTGFLE